ncbi:MAG: SLBB domain-containing protein [Nodosilinea sp.]
MPGSPEPVSSSPRVNLRTPPTSAANTEALLQPQTEEAYRLGVGDQVQVDLFRVPEYSGQYEVQVDGNVNLALVGPVRVEGLTVEAATAAISERYSQVLRRPIVTLNITSRRPLVVGVAGEVNRPGSYSLRIEGTSYPKLTQLLQEAGGITQSADLRNVQIRRRERGTTETITTDLWHLLNTGDLSQDIILRDGDSIVIPSTLVPLDEGSLVANASFYADTSQPINIAVVGEVFRPGPYRLRGGSTRTGEAGEIGQEGSSGSLVTVTDAIQVAGGIKPRANIRQVQVRRTTRAGTEETFDVDLMTLLEAGDLRQNAILQEGDTVFIPVSTAALDPVETAQVASATFSPNTIQINVVGEAQRTGVIQVPPNTPLNQGILAAGGFNDRARESSVGLVRLNPDGTVSQREIPVDFSQGLSEENNPALQNNDIIIIATSGAANFSDGLGQIAGPIADLLNIIGAPFRFLNFFD